jgi:hypothetical protein
MVIKIKFNFIFQLVIQDTYNLLIILEYIFIYLIHYFRLLNIKKTC